MQFGLRAHQNPQGPGGVIDIMPVKLRLRRLLSETRIAQLPFRFEPALPRRLELSEPAIIRDKTGVPQRPLYLADGRLRERNLFQQTFHGLTNRSRTRESLAIVVHRFGQRLTSSAAAFMAQGLTRRS